MEECSYSVYVIFLVRVRYLNCDFRINIGTLGGDSSFGIFVPNQLVATPFTNRLVGVVYSTLIAVTCTVVGYS